MEEANSLCHCKDRLHHQQMMKEEGLRSQVACYADHVLKAQGRNKGKAEQLECNCGLIKHFYTYTLSCNKYERQHRENKLETYRVRNVHSNMQKSKLQQIEILSSTPANTHTMAAPQFYLHHLSVVQIDSHCK